MDYFGGGSKGTMWMDEQSPYDKFGPTARASAAIAAFENSDSSTTTRDLIEHEFQRLRAEVEQNEGPKVEDENDENHEWPEHLGGMQLGRIVNRMRDGSLEVKHIPERKAVLDAIGFDWGDERYFLDFPFDKAMVAFLMYWMTRGETWVEYNFIVPDSAPWPKPVVGFRLGRCIERIRRLQYYLETYHPEKVQLLKELEFTWREDDTMTMNVDAAHSSQELVDIATVGMDEYNFRYGLSLDVYHRFIKICPNYKLYHKDEELDAYQELDDAMEKINPSDNETMTMDEAIACMSEEEVEHCKQVFLKWRTMLATDIEVTLLKKVELSLLMDNFLNKTMGVEELKHHDLAEEFQVVFSNTTKMDEEVMNTTDLHELEKVQEVTEETRSEWRKSGVGRIIEQFHDEMEDMERFSQSYEEHIEQLKRDPDAPITDPQLREDLLGDVISVSEHDPKLREKLAVLTHRKDPWKQYEPIDLDRITPGIFDDEENYENEDDDNDRFQP